MKKLFLLMAVVCTAFVMNSCAKAPQEPIVEKETIDKERVKQLITDICNCSSQGDNYYAMEECFADTIWPHPSGKPRYRHNIADKTRRFVESYPYYEVSDPYNFTFLNDTFPLTVKCNVDINWVNKNYTEKEALMRKTYYINADYKVTGYEDKELDRETVQEYL
jgi:hypothetical protein